MQLLGHSTFAADIECRQLGMALLDCCKVVPTSVHAPFLTPLQCTV